MMSHIRMYLAPAACFGLLAAPAAGQWVSDADLAMRAGRETYGQSRGPEQTEQISRTFAVGPSGSLELTNMSGRVRITGGPGNEMRIEAVKRVRPQSRSAARDNDLRGQLDAVKVEMSERGGRVEVNTRYTASNSRVSVDYTVTMPSTGSAFVKTMSGGVVVANLQGELRAEAMSGDVSASRAGKQVALKTMSGNVTLESAAPDADVNLQTLSGDVVLQSMTLAAAELTSISGDVTLVDVTAGRVRANSTTGTVQFSGALVKGGRYELRSHAGSVELLLAGSTGFEIEADTFNGTINTELPLNLKTGQRSRRTVRATFGDGSAFVSARTFNGDVTIKRR